MLFKKLFFFVAIVIASQPSIRADVNKTKIDAQEDVYEWLILGGGPAGISVLGVLLDLNVPAKKIVWVDAAFNAGRIGEYYATVPANNITAKFVDFINACNSFKACETSAIQELKNADPDEFPELGIIVPALNDLSAFLRTQVPSHQGCLHDLHFDESNWHAQVNNINITARNVVLATGSHPKELNYTDNKEMVIPLDHALDKTTLAKYLTTDDVVGVVGGSHSGILVLKFLHELNAKKIINFYRSPIVYTINMGTWSMNAYNGLKGLTAQWAREVLEGPNPPAHIVRVFNNEENRTLYLPECTKLIYSVGYERNDLPLTPEHADLEYNDKTGVIAPGLFGIGIAFPEHYVDHLGNEDHRVGLTSFMDYAQRIVPQWLIGSEEELRALNYQRSVLQKFDDLFHINIL